jgi:hypothetical protein
MHIMSDSTDNIAMTTAMNKAQAEKSKAPAKGKAKTAAPQAPRTMPQAQARQVVTLATAERICPNEAVASKISTCYGLEFVDFHAIRDTTNEALVNGAVILEGNLNDKAMEMHMQRIVDGYVRSAHGAGNFYDAKAAQARQLTSAIGNEDRDEDRQGVDGMANKAQRACEFAAEVGLQAYALLAAAQGAVDAYAHVVGKDWKPYEGMTTPSRAVSTRSLALQAGAFSKE